jgi:hypothetical protein
MKKMNFEQMEVINGGQTVVAAPTNIPIDEGLNKKCLLALGAAFVIGTGGVIVTAATGGTGAAIAWSIAANWGGWIIAGVTSC